jgi:hypothetical protein
MRAKKLLLVSMLFVLAGLAGGCHYGSDDHDRRRYGSGYGNSEYRDGFRDGRAYERRRDDWSVTDYLRRRW